MFCNSSWICIPADIRYTACPGLDFSPELQIHIYTHIWGLHLWCSKYKTSEPEPIRYPPRPTTCSSLTGSIESLFSGADSQATAD